ncbi:uncharacterized protein LOC103721295 [Phoenix dactylifera]|uniref:Uncharacterized protein LOC103721295 n=1 Tax=Phoenix dactylifera TaxID=42345 RepID=A0A8B7MWP6_PHODC|nr:uncharacterized protein LOC103721295 [Phoenix dactylifera]XP_017701795.1 uncharacterized protein LOC103721295 [Phoenix dactylifera]
MPKERRTRSASFERRSRGSPFPCSSSCDRRHSSSSSSSSASCRPCESSVPSAKDTKEWEEIHCPVCMEHPHNAVLLLCASREKGCRAFMCDTSYRHSNCLDQYRKSFSESQPSQQGAEGQQPEKLLCPLCRGLVTGWTVVEPARQYLNAKIRGCAMESCGFSGVYGELRRHARKEHPSVRPSEVDPERQRDWRRLEQQRDLGDLFSMFRSPIAGEEDGIGVIGDDEELSGGTIPFPSITVFLIVQVTRAGGMGSPRPSLRSSRSSSRGSSRSRRGRGMILWEETFSEQESSGRPTSNGIDDADDDGNASRAEDAPVASRQGQGRRRRQLRMSDNDDEEDDEDELL